eukprot:6617860-Prymnesium_polylepis.1
MSAAAGRRNSPQALARQLGVDGCAAVLEWLKEQGGVGMIADPHMIGAFLGRSATGEEERWSWVEALRFELPFILGAWATRCRIPRYTQCSH